jgi:hypothetical protein
MGRTAIATPKFGPNFDSLFVRFLFILEMVAPSPYERALKL